MLTTITNKSGSRFAELDGLRALAIVPVILFHCDIAGILDGGFFGVDIFFTISGFIITAMLVHEIRTRGDFNFGDFYLRRLKRLVPPVLGLILLALLVTPMISQDAYARLRSDIWAALAYCSNWWQIHDKQSYFDDTPRILKHLWSLAVEEQFYFFWPPIAYLVLKRFGAKATGFFALLLACAGTAWMLYLYQLNPGDADHNRIYLGTDTHAMGLLLGAALACFWNPYARKGSASADRTGLRAGAVVALVGLGCMMQMMNDQAPKTYEGAFLLVPLLTAIVIYCLMNDAGFVVSRLLRRPVFQWIGLRSYSLYLVHGVVFVWMQLLGYKDFSDWRVFAAGIAIVAVLSEWMYRYVEMPSKRLDPGRFGAKRIAKATVAYTAVALAFFALAPTVAPDDKGGALQAAMPAPAPVPVAVAPLPQQGPAPAPEPDLPISGGQDILAIGDSVLLGASAHLARDIPGIRIDAAVGRQASSGLKVLKEGHGRKAPTVLLHLGTNGYIDEGQFRALLQALADRKSVLIVNFHAERRWTRPNNELIARLAGEFPNVHVVDWSAASASHPEYFVKDGIHLSTKGIAAFTSAIKVASGGSVIIAPTAPKKMLASNTFAKMQASRQAVDAFALPDSRQESAKPETAPAPPAHPATAIRPDEPAPRPPDAEATSPA